MTIRSPIRKNAKMRCATCCLELPLLAFYPYNKTKCKECIKAYTRQYRRDRIEHHLTYDRKRANDPSRVIARAAYSRTPEGQIARALAHARYKAANPVRKKALNELSNAIRDGKVFKQPCFVCGSAVVEGHHVSYDMPIDVAWLCSRHHKQVHKEHRERERK